MLPFSSDCLQTQKLEYVPCVPQADQIVVVVSVPTWPGEMRVEREKRDALVTGFFDHLHLRLLAMSETHSAAAVGEQ